MGEGKLTNLSPRYRVEAGPLFIGPSARGPFSALDFIGVLWISPDAAVLFQALMPESPLRRKLANWPRRHWSCLVSAQV